MNLVSIHSPGIPDYKVSGLLRSRIARQRRIKLLELEHDPIIGWWFNIFMWVPKSNPAQSVSLFPFVIACAIIGILLMVELATVCLPLVAVHYTKSSLSYRDSQNNVF